MAASGATAASVMWFSGNFVRKPKRTSGCFSRIGATVSSSLLSVMP